MRRIVCLFSVVLLALACGNPTSDLGRAARAGNLEEVRRLLAAGANPNPPVAGFEISPVALAARIGRPDILAALLDAGANPEKGSGINDWTTLVHAVHRGQPGSVELLLSRTHPSQASLSAALDMAASYGDPKTVRMLLDAGARGTQKTLVEAVGGAWDIDVKWNGCEPHTASVRALLSASPELRVPDSTAGRAALRFAEKKGCTEMLSLVQGEVRAAR